MKGFDYVLEQRECMELIRDGGAPSLLLSISAAAITRGGNLGSFMQRKQILATKPESLNYPQTVCGEHPHPYCCYNTFS